MPTIAVFGSSMVLPESTEYETALAVGRLLAQANFAVMTGGYQGVMEAVSRGASEAGGHVIGVTSAPIETIRRNGPNRWLEQIIPYNTLRERLIHLILHADGYIVLPGGVGTFAELLMAWELMRVNEIPPRPIVCDGTYWRGILEALHAAPYVRTGYWDMIQYADTAETMADLVVRSFA